MKVTKALSTKAELHIGLTDSAVVHFQNLLPSIFTPTPLNFTCIEGRRGGVQRYEQPSSIIRRH